MTVPTNDDGTVMLPGPDASAAHVVAAASDPVEQVAVAAVARPDPPDEALEAAAQHPSGNVRMFVATSRHLLRPGRPWSALTWAAFGDETDPVIRDAVEVAAGGAVPDEVRTVWTVNPADQRGTEWQDPSPLPHVDDDVRRMPGSASTVLPEYGTSAEGTWRRPLLGDRDEQDDWYAYTGRLVTITYDDMDDEDRRTVCTCNGYATGQYSGSPFWAFDASGEAYLEPLCGPVYDEEGTIREGYNQGMAVQVATVTHPQVAEGWGMSYEQRVVAAAVVAVHTLRAFRSDVSDDTVEAWVCDDRDPVGVAAASFAGFRRAGPALWVREPIYRYAADADHRLMT